MSPNLKKMAISSIKPMMYRIARNVMK